MYLRTIGTTPDEFIADLREQADERARQSLALDAFARHLGIEVTEDDLKAEFERSGVEDFMEQMRTFVEEGRMPAVREAIRRTKALAWLADNADVSIVDEIAEAADEDEEAESEE